jgi:hypothetical protein
MIAPTLQHIIRALSNIKIVSTLGTSSKVSYVKDVADRKDYLLLGFGAV